MTMGQKIRALRLGWYSVPELEAWMRVSILGTDRILVNLAPLHELAPARTKPASYVCIGSGRGCSPVSKRLLPLMPALRHLKRVLAPFSVIVSDHGELIQHGGEGIS